MPDMSTDVMPDAAGVAAQGELSQAGAAQVGPLLQDRVTPSVDKTPETPEYLALKYIFYTPKHGDMNGGFCVIFEGNTGRMILQTLCLTRKEIEITFGPDEGWRSFGKLISQMGPYDKIWGDKLLALLPSLITEEDRIALFDEVDSRKNKKGNKNLLRLEGAICKAFERATHSFLNVDCDVELVTRRALEEGGLLEPREGAEQVKEEKEEKERSFEGTVISCRPLVDPVRGKPSTDVLPGDLLEVGLDGDVGASGLIQKHLRATNQAPVFPVEEVDRRENKTYIYLRISDEVRGLLTLTKTLRLKTRRASTEKERNKSALEDLGFFIMIGVALIGLLLAIRYLFF